MVVVSHLPADFAACQARHYSIVYMTCTTAVQAYVHSILIQGTHMFPIGLVRPSERCRSCDISERAECV